MALHEVALLGDVYPTGQASQRADMAWLAYVRGGHITHATPSLEALPGLHGVHTRTPADGTDVE